MHVGCFRGYERVRAALEAESRDYDLLITEGESLVTRARNNAVAAFLNSDYDTLCFIDADVEILDTSDFLNMLDLPEIRGAAVPMKTNDHSEALSCWRDGKMLTRSELQAGGMVQEVDYLGAAVMAIDRNVLETLWSRHPELTYDDSMGGKGCALFEPVLVDGAYLSEDYGFCELARAEGFSVWVEPFIKVRHYGQAFWSF